MSLYIYVEKDLTPLRVKTKSFVWPLSYQLNNEYKIILVSKETSSKHAPAV